MLLQPLFIRRIAQASVARAVLAALALALGAACASAQSLQVVTEPSPYSYLRDGRVTGNATEIVETTLQRAGLPAAHFNVYPWARAYATALREPNVLIYLIARTPAREDQFKWVGEFMRTEYHLYKLKGNNEVSVRTLADARAYVVGVTRDDLRHQYLQSKGFGKLVVSGQNLDNFRKLVNRQIQLIPLPERDKSAMCDELKFDCNQLEKLLTLEELSTGLYLAASLPTSDAVVARLRTAFEQLRAEGMVGRLMASPTRR